jgi:hypothetical protein
MRVETIEFIVINVLNIALIYYKKNNLLVYGAK